VADCGAVFNVLTTPAQQIQNDKCPKTGEPHKLFQRPDDTRKRLPSVEGVRRKDTAADRFLSRKGILQTINAEGDVEEITERLEEALQAATARTPAAAAKRKATPAKKKAAAKKAAAEKAPPGSSGKISGPEGDCEEGPAKRQRRRRRARVRRARVPHQSHWQEGWREGHAPSHRCGEGRAQNEERPCASRAGEEEVSREEGCEAQPLAAVATRWR